ncbi:uncharacterized protein LOC101212897 [Cucumis sativus]|nr:uncharacterized protein LOC101212897 [Cucumis sativus]
MKEPPRFFFFSESAEEFGEREIEMGKSFTLIQTVATAGAFSAISFWYGFMFGRESARKDLGDLIQDLRRGISKPDSSSETPHS